MENPPTLLLPENYPYEWVRQVTLEDGTSTVIRPIRPDDVPRMQHGFTHLSQQSIYFRFLDTSTQLSDELAHRLANLDYENHMALVASIIEDSVEELIGVARYARTTELDSTVAETAIIVRDDYHGRGLGTLLYVYLIQYARQHGVEAFVGTVHHNNSPMMKFIRNSGLSFERQMIEPGIFQVKIWLDVPTPPS